MKKLLFPILFLLMVLPAMSQSFVTIHGTITDTLTGNPIPNQPVIIVSDSSGGWVYYATVYTNNTGFYVDTVPVAPSGGTGILYVRTIDCQNYMHQVVLTFNPVNFNFTVNFSICSLNVPCTAFFTYLQPQPLTVWFTDVSNGGNGIRNWSFGDGGTSTQQNPVHAYAQSGFYNVTLTIGALGTTCYNSYSQTIYVWDSTGGGCHAAFVIYPDSNALNSFHFVDQSFGNIETYTWSFGDGETQTITFPQNPNVTHTYSQAGMYNVCLLIQGIDSACYDMTCDTLIVGIPPTCHAAFTYYADTAGNGNTIHFVDQSTGNIAYWGWSFGDGGYSNEQNPVHTYASAGYYVVTLSVNSPNQWCFDNITYSILVGSNTGCIANFAYSDPTDPNIPVQFTDLSQVNGGGPITSWNWNFGDPSSGSMNFSSLQNPSHLFTAPGYYNVCLTIHGADSSCFSTICQYIRVGSNTGCQADFTYSTNPSSGSHTVTFTDLSSGPPVSWQWSFGDGTGSNLQNPVHTYAAPGTYYVCLTIAGINCTSTFCQDVVVNDSSTYHQIYGQVFAGNFPLSSGLVLIFSLDTNINYQPFIDIFQVDSNGVYYFTQVPDGSYYILAIPFTSNGYLPTYYGNTISWQQATLITLGTPANPYNINLVSAGPMTNGPGSASGQINMGGLKSSMIDKVSMILLNDQLQPIGFTAVSTAGAFDFPTLAYGTYYLHAEMPGVTSDYVRIDLTAERPHAEVVMTFTGNKILGIRDNTAIVSGWNVYPNPVADQITVNLNMNRGARAEIGIYNLAGQMMLGTRAVLGEGENRIGVSTASLAPGIYSLRILSPDGLIINTKLVKTR